MNKEEILQRSRAENKDQDLYAKEVQREGAHLAAGAAIILAAIFFILEEILGYGFNFSYYAIIAVFLATFQYSQWKITKEPRNRNVAILFAILSVFSAVIHIIDLIINSVH